MPYRATLGGGLGRAPQTRDYRDQRADNYSETSGEDIGFEWLNTADQPYDNANGRNGNFGRSTRPPDRNIYGRTNTREDSNRPQETRGNKLARTDYSVVNKRREPNLGGTNPYGAFEIDDRPWSRPNNGFSNGDYGMDRRGSDFSRRSGNEWVNKANSGTMKEWMFSKVRVCMV